MKKYIVILLVFILSLLLNLKESNAYIPCNSYIIKPKEVSTLSLEKYLNKINYKEINYFCSNSKCYQINEGKISESIENFNKIYNKTLSDDEYNNIYVKGYPITKISINNCK